MLIVAAPGHLLPIRFRNQQVDLEDLSHSFWHEQDFKSNSSTFWMFGLIFDIFLLISAIFALLLEVGFG